MLQRAGLLYGPRGVGKTTWMLSQVEKHHLLYFSADNPVLSTTHLFGFLEGIFMRDYEGVLIDEVHYATDHLSTVALAKEGGLRPLRGCMSFRGRGGLFKNPGFLQTLRDEIALQNDPLVRPRPHTRSAAAV